MILSLPFWLSTVPRRRGDEPGTRLSATIVGLMQLYFPLALTLFSISGKFRQRLNDAFTLVPAIEEVMRTVGNMATEMVKEAHVVVAE